MYDDEETDHSRTKRAARRSRPAADHDLYTVGWSNDGDAYVARVAWFPSPAAHGDSQDAALRSIQQVLRAVLKDVAASKEPIPQPLGKRSFSGRLNRTRTNQTFCRSYANSEPGLGAALVSSAVTVSSEHKCGFDNVH